MFEHDNNSGSLFANDKGGNEKRPDCKGSIKIEGKVYDLAGWKTTGRNSGKTYLSLKVALPRTEGTQTAPQGARQYTPPQQQQPQEPVRQPAPSYAPVKENDDLPF